MPKLIIKRSFEWNNMIRNIGLYLDEEKVGTIANGQVKEFELEPREYSLRSKIDWAGSETLKFTLSDNETKRVELSGFKHGNFLMPLVLIISIVYLVFGEELNFDTLLFVLLMSPVVLIQFYYMTLGRNNYLRLEER